jgi:hypothetical protein
VTTREMVDGLRRLGGRGRWGRWGALLVALAGVAVFLRVMNEPYPVEKWLFWIYAEL